MVYNHKMQKLPLTVQINLSPGDYPLAKHLLEKQIEIFSENVDEILLTVETKKSKGRFGEGWEANSEKLNELLNALSNKYALIIDPIDYRCKKEVAEYFFGSKFIPEKDHRGGPYYCYFYGMYKAKNNIILHLDSDIFLGGKSQNWIREAFELHQNSSVFTTSPLPGPPSKTGRTILKQSFLKELSDNRFLMDGFSTRLFTINKKIFEGRKLKVEKVGLKNSLKAYIKGQQPFELPENIIAKFIRTNDYKRIDFLGTGSGLWSLHPPYKTDRFFSELENILKKINEYTFPDNQIGFYDIVDELCDWSDARENLKNNRWWRKALKS